MAEFDELKNLIRLLLTQRFSPKPNYIKGLLGDGLGNVEVPNKPDHNFVRFNRSTTEFFEVFNRTVTAVHGWPVLIGELPWQSGLTQVVDTDWEAYEQSGWGDKLGGTGPHAPTHEWPDRFPGSDPLNVYMRSIIPLRAYSLGSGTTTIYVNAYEYEHNATGVVWGGIPGIDLSSVMTATATGTMRHVGIYLNPANNLLGIVTGTTTVHSDALDPPFVDFPGSSIPAARVRIYGGQAAINESDIEDARRPFAPGVTGSAGGGAPTGDAGGDLTGTYPNPLVAGLFGASLLDTAPSAGDILYFTGSAWQPSARGAAGAWPRPGISMIGTTEYADFATAVAAASSGDEIRIGAGTDTSIVVEADVTDIHIMAGQHTSAVLSSTIASVMYAESSRLSNFSITHSANSGSSVDSLVVHTDCYVTNLKIVSTNAGAGASRPLSITGGGSFIIQCHTEGKGEAVVVDTSGTSGDTIIQGGYFKSTADYAIEIISGDLILAGPILEGSSGTLQVTGGTAEGWYYDEAGNLYVVNANTTAAKLISGLSEKVSPASGDWLWLEETATAGSFKKVQVGNVSGSGTDEKVKVSSDDTTADYLLNKLAVTAPITLTETSPGGDEDATIAVSSATEGAEGVTEIATQAEVDTGSDDDRFVTPLKLSNYIKFRRAIIEDQKTTNTAGGTFTSGAFQTRDLNTEVLDEITITLSSNQFTLPAGTYYIFASAPCYRGQRHQTRLRNITDSTTDVVGTSEFSSSADNVENRSLVEGTFTIAASKTFELQHQCGNTQANNGFGVESNYGPYEIYSRVHLLQVA